MKYAGDNVFSFLVNIYIYIISVSLYYIFTRVRVFNTFLFLFFFTFILGWSRIRVANGFGRPGARQVCTGSGTAVERDAVGGQGRIHSKSYGWHKCSQILECCEFTRVRAYIQILCMYKCKYIIYIQRCVCTFIRLQRSVHHLRLTYSYVIIR